MCVDVAINRHNLATLIKRGFARGSGGGDALARLTLDNDYP